MKLSSIEALQEKQAELRAKNNEPRPEVRIALATCAIATGAMEVKDAIEKALANEDLYNVVVKPTGCLGYCYAEPTVEVDLPGEETVVYGPVDEALAMQIVSKHIKGGHVLTDHVVDTCHINA